MGMGEAPLAWRMGVDGCGVIGDPSGRDDDKGWFGGWGGEGVWREVRGQGGCDAGLEDEGG